MKKMKTWNQKTRTLSSIAESLRDEGLKAEKIGRYIVFNGTNLDKRHAINLLYRTMKGAAIARMSAEELDMREETRRELARELAIETARLESLPSRAMGG